MPLIVKYFITLTLNFVTNAVWAQTAITYEYDDAGNRISRRITGKSNGIFKSQIICSRQLRNCCNSRQSAGSAIQPRCRDTGFHPQRPTLRMGGQRDVTVFRNNLAWA